MVKEYTFKIDIEKQRKELYDFINQQLDEGFTFHYKTHNEWVNDNVVKKGENILYFDNVEFESEYESRIVIFIAGFEYSLFFIKLFLTKKKENFKLLKYQKGE